MISNRVTYFLSFLMDIFIIPGDKVMLFDLEVMQKLYRDLPAKLKAVRQQIHYPLTLTEKILYTHISGSLGQLPVRGKTYVDFYPDRVAMQDATAQMALLQIRVFRKKKNSSSLDSSLRPPDLS